MTRTGRRHRVLLLSALVLVPAFLFLGLAGFRVAAADGCWVDRERAREERRQREQEEEERRQREEEERAERERERARDAREEGQQSRPTTPPPLPPTTGGGRPRRRAAGKSSFRETWRGWWVVNDRALLPARVWRTAPPTTPSEDGAADAAWARREIVLRVAVLPTMRAVLEPKAKSPDLMLRGALIGLGKAARTEDGPALLAHWLDEEGATSEVREAAALGLGLLRRTEPERRFAPEVLDALRGKLLRVVEDDVAPDPVRGTCAISLGLLGDQPFGDGVSADGRLLVQRLWRDLGTRSTGTDLTVGLLTAIGMQPGASVTAEMRERLHEITLGRPALKRTWNDVERGHALAALVRLQGSRSAGTLRAALTARRIPLAVRRAALVALGRAVSRLSAGDRLQAARALRTCLRRVHDPLTRGLTSIAAGHLVAAHAGAGGALGGGIQALLGHLESQARGGSTLTRGFAAVALGVAFRGTDGDRGTAWKAARRAAERLLRTGLGRGRGDENQLGAYAVALGLMRSRDAIPLLTRTVEARDELPMVRWDAAVALAQIGDPGPDAVRALNLALFDRHPRVRTGAALGLSMLSGPLAGRRLLRELEQANSTEEIARLTEPLGCLLDPSEARELSAFVRCEKNTVYARASMLVALGNIADPEHRPSLGRLGLHANYPGDVPSLMAAILAR